MKSSIFLGLIFLFGVMQVTAQTPPIQPGVSQELARWRAERYSDIRYKLNLTLEKMSPVLKGTIEIRVKVGTRTPSSASEVPPIVLDWRTIKGHEEKSTVSNVSINGRRAFVSPPQAAVADEGVRVPYENEHLVFRDGVVAGENVIKLDFTSPILTSGSAITRYVDKEDGSEYIYSLFVPSDASTAFPVFDQPDLKARFSYSITGPKNWDVISNSKVFARLTGIECDRCPTDDRAPFTFMKTKPISTYVFAFAAGPFQKFDPTGGNPSGSEGVSSSPNKNTLPTGRVSASDVSGSIYVRKSQAEKFQPHAPEVFRLNREAVKYFEEYFDYKFPFPKYDLVLIPEFPFGGMEHAGATYLRESSIIFPQEPTRNDHISRALLIFHEASHQWFGDTVTMRWFDDLWLKEGFATFTAYKAMEKIMPEMLAWKVFYERVKQAAYQTDSTKGTTPIYQPIENLSAAKSAYGNIVYNKAPAFLRQAEFYLGEDKFRDGVRRFLRKYEFGNATWQELIDELAGYKNSHVYEFARPFVTGPGVPIIRFIRDTPGSISWEDGKDHFTMFTNALGYTYSKNYAKHGNFGMAINLLLRYPNESIVQRKLIDARNGYLMEFPRERDAQGRPVGDAREPLLIFPNIGDFGYGIFLLDEKSRDYVLKNIQNEKDPFLRSMMWGALWDSVREGELDPKEYVELAIKNLPAEQDESMVASILARSATAMNYYLPASLQKPEGGRNSQRPAYALADAQPSASRVDLQGRLENILIERMKNAPTLGQRITFYRALLNIAASEKARKVLKEMLRNAGNSGGNLSGSEGVSSPPKKNTLPTGRVSASDEKIPLKTKDRFDIVTRLLILGDPDAPKLLADLEKTETSDDAKRYAYAAKAGIATAENKARYWKDFTENKEISESWIEAAYHTWNSIRHSDLTLPYLQRALQELPNHKRNRKIFFVNGWLGAFIGGQRSQEAPDIVNKFLAENPGLDNDLRLKILENVDLIERAVKIRAKYGTLSFASRG
jgi:aminopeptidase N